jgi:hypothetical protein
MEFIHRKVVRIRQLFVFPEPGENEWEALISLIRASYYLAKPTDLDAKEVENHIPSKQEAGKFISFNADTQNICVRMESVNGRFCGTHIDRAGNFLIFNTSIFELDRKDLTEVLALAQQLMRE